MSRVIAIINEKGGVGKTTTCVNLAAALVRCGKKVLIIDADPQGHASKYLGMREGEKVTITNMIQYVIMGMPFDPHEAIRHHKEGIDVIVANKLLVGIEATLYSLQDKDKILKTYVDMIAPEYDFVFIDCGPKLNAWTVNILAAANSVLIPVQPQPLAADGLVEVLRTIIGVQHGINRGLEIEGILFTMDSGNYNNSKMTKNEVLEAFGVVRIFETVIPKSEALAEAVRDEVSVFEYKKNCTGAKQYMALAKEVLGYEHE